MAQWIWRFARYGRLLTPAGLAAQLGIELGHWLIERGWAYIKAYNDPPKTLEELQKDLYYADGKWHCHAGYDAHHIVEKAQAERDGESWERIDGRDNLVCISTLRHWEVTGWMMRKSDRYTDSDAKKISPREHLRGKSWEEKRQIGLRALRENGVLKDSGQ